MEPFQRQLKGNVSNQEPSSNRDFTEQTKARANGSLHKLMEVSSSENSEARCMASGNDQSICSAMYTLGFLGAKWFPKHIDLNRLMTAFRANMQKHFTGKFWWIPGYNWKVTFQWSKSTFSWKKPNGTNTLSHSQLESLPNTQGKQAVP